LPRFAKECSVKESTTAETDGTGEDETEVMAAAEVLRVSFRALAGSTTSAWEPVGILSAEERDALAAELRAGRRGDAVLAHTLAWLLVPSESGPRPDTLRGLGLASAPPAAVKELGKVAQMAALARRASDYVRGERGDVPAELAAVELVEWDWDGALKRVQALNPALLPMRQEPDSEEMVQAHASVRGILIDLLVTATSGSPVSAILEPSLSPLRLQALASRVLSALVDFGCPTRNQRREHVLSWYSRTAASGVVRAAVCRLAAEAALEQAGGEQRSLGNAE
jgi:hypothetical protein